jgi:hypothetical protein
MSLDISSSISAMAHSISNSADTVVGGIKNFGQRTLRQLGFGEAPRLKDLQKSAAKPVESSGKNILTRSIKNITGKIQNPRVNLKPEKAAQELERRSWSSEFSKNKPEDLAIILQRKTAKEMGRTNPAEVETDAELKDRVKEYLEDVPPADIQKSVEKLEKTAKSYYGGNTENQNHHIQGWLGGKDAKLGEVLWQSMREIRDTLTVEPSKVVKDNKNSESFLVVSNEDKSRMLLSKSVRFGRRSRARTDLIQGKPKELGEGGVNKVYTDGKQALKKEVSMPQKEGSNKDIADHDLAGLLQVPASKPNALGRNLAFYNLNCLLGQGKATVALEVKAVVHEDELYQAMELAKGQPGNGRPEPCKIGGPELLQKYKDNKSAIAQAVDKREAPSQDREEALYYTMMHHYNKFQDSDGAYGTRLDAYFEEQGLGRGAVYDKDKASFTFEIFDNHKSKIVAGGKVDCTDKFIEEKIDWNDPKLQHLSEDLQLTCIISCQQDFNPGNYFLDVDSQGKCQSLQAIDRDFGFFENFEAIDKIISSKLDADQLTKQLDTLSITKEGVETILKKSPHRRTAQENGILQQLFAEAYLSDRDIKTKVQLPLKITAETYKKYTQSFNASEIETLCKDAGLGKAASFATNALLEKVQEHIRNMVPVTDKDGNPILNNAGEPVAYKVKEYREPEPELKAGERPDPNVLRQNPQNTLRLGIKQAMLDQEIRLDKDNNPWLKAQLEAKNTQAA